MQTASPQVAHRDGDVERHVLDDVDARQTRPLVDVGDADPDVLVLVAHARSFTL
jgi:hypothetical protein